MPTHPEFANHCADLLRGIGSVLTKRMFSGYGVYVDDVFAAVITGDDLYLKTDDETLPRFAAAGGRQFCFTSRGKLQATHFWSAPAPAMDSAAQMRPWAQLALEAALRARTKKPKKRPCKAFLHRHCSAEPNSRAQGRTIVPPNGKAH